MTREQVRIESVWLENRRGVDGLGIGDPRPRLSWIASAVPDAWELEFRRDDGVVRAVRLPADRTRLVDWPFDGLRSREGGELRVRAEGAGSWSTPLRVEAGLLHREDWSVPFISPSPAAPAGTLRPG